MLAYARLLALDMGIHRGTLGRGRERERKRTELGSLRKASKARTKLPCAGSSP